MAAPIIPAINDEELETILTRAYSAGAREGSYVVLRLPGELRDMFREWLQVHYPDRLKRAVSLMQSMREGKDYEAQWGRRMAGSGPYAWMIGRRFEMAARRLGFARRSRALRTDLFRKPTPRGERRRRAAQPVLTRPAGPARPVRSLAAVAAGFAQGGHPDRRAASAQPEKAEARRRLRGARAPVARAARPDRGRAAAPRRRARRLG